MSIPQDLRFSVGGFSPKRMAYMLTACSLVLVPVHSWLPCEASEVLGGFALMVAVITRSSVLAHSAGRAAPVGPEGFRSGSVSGAPRVDSLIMYLAAYRWANLSMQRIGASRLVQPVLNAQWRLAPAADAGR